MQLHGKSLLVPWEERLYLILSIQIPHSVFDWILIDTQFHNDLENYPQRRSQRAEMRTVCCYYVSKVKVGQIEMLDAQTETLG